MVFILYKLFIWKDSFLKEADYFWSMSRVPGVGNCLFLHSQGRGWGIEHQLKKKIANPRRCARGGGDGNSENRTMHKKSLVCLVQLLVEVLVPVTQVKVITGGRITEQRTSWSFPLNRTRHTSQILLPVPKSSI